MIAGLVSVRFVGGTKIEDVMENDFRDGHRRRISAELLVSRVPGVIVSSWRDVPTADSRQQKAEGPVGTIKPPCAKYSNFRRFGARIEEKNVGTSTAS